jgi:hypothetical protein
MTDIDEKLMIEWGRLLVLKMELNDIIARIECLRKSKADEESGDE